MKSFSSNRNSRLLNAAIVMGLTTSFSTGCRSTNRVNSATSNPTSIRQVDTIQVDSQNSLNSNSLNHPGAGPVSLASAQVSDGAQVKIAGESNSEVEQTNDLTLPQLVAQVHSINPTLEAMRATLHAAMQRIPQASALDDPMFSTSAAPESLGSSQVESAYALEISQKLPWHGKRSLRGAAAKSEASSASYDYLTAKQKLTEVVELEYWDYYSSLKLIELNQQNAIILKSIRANAENRYRTGLVTEQDVLQAEVELANLEQRLIELERMNRVSKGNLNALLRRGPNEELSISPNLAAMDEPLANADSLMGIAVASRPELSAVSMQIQSDRTRVALARKQFYPDTELFFRHDTFWQPVSTQSALREQVGFRMNLPIYRKRLNAAVCETTYEVSKTRAEYDQLLLDIQREVTAAHERVLESQRTIILYSSQIVPTAEQNVAVARSNYDNSKSTFLELAIAQRQLIEFKERLLLAQVELQRRNASLRRLTGVM